MLAPRLHERRGYDRPGDDMEGCAVLHYRTVESLEPCSEWPSQMILRLRGKAIKQSGRQVHIVLFTL